jgi:hypothetical protein
MNLLLSLLPAVAPWIQIYLLWSIVRHMRALAEEAAQKKELADMVKKFGQMFADAADVPRPPAKKKMVSFEATDA